jgi:hypothetical protein
MGTPSAFLEGGAPVHLLLCAIVFAEPDVSLKDLDRFPPLSEVLKVARPALAQHSWIEMMTLRTRRARKGGVEDRDLLNWIDWHSKNLDSWCALAMAQGYCEYAPEGRVLPLRLRIDSLRYLRKTLGPEAYRKGKMPLPNLLQ